MAIEVGTPVTIWSGRGGEYAVSGPFLLADASGKLLADASGNNLIDGGLKFTPLDTTVWNRDDSK